MSMSAPRACSDEPLLLKVLCAMRAIAPARSGEARPGIVVNVAAEQHHVVAGTEIDRRPRRARHLEIDQPDVRRPRDHTACPSGVAASPTIRNPASSAFAHVSRRHRRVLIGRGARQAQNRAARHTTDADGCHPSA